MTIKVYKKNKSSSNDSTDLSLLVSSASAGILSDWDKKKVIQSLEEEAGLDIKDARKIAAEAEERILATGIKNVSTGTIRSIIDDILFEKGLNSKLKQQQVLGIPTYDLEQYIFSKTSENSNIAANNPEAVSLAISEAALKQYALSRVFSKEVADAHLTGKVHLHDLGYITRVYCSSHSLEYIKKYGLQLENLQTSSKPSSHARTLTGHLNTFLASMQAYYAGALGIGYINIFYAPLLKGLTYAQMKQEAQYLIFSGSQNAFSRGGQTLFLDFNIHTGIPSYLKKIKAIGPGGKYLKETYADFEKEAQMFAKALLEVWQEGDRYGRVFAFPKCDFHISAETFTDKEQYKLFEYACEVASDNGSPYFVFDRDEVTLAACCFEGPEQIDYRDIDSGELKSTAIKDYVEKYHKEGNKINSFNFEKNIEEEVEIIGTLVKHNSENELIEIEDEDGKTLRVTSDHLFMVKDSETDNLVEISAGTIVCNPERYLLLA